MNLEELLQLWRARQEAAGLRERTIAERAGLIRRFQTFAGGDPAKPSAARMTLFLGRPGLKPRTRWVYRQHLAAWSDFLVAVRVLEASPMDDVPIVRKPSTSDPRPIEPYQLAALLEKVEGPARMMVLLAAYAGLRVHEIAKVEGRDLDRVGGILTVEGKGGKTVPLPAHPSIVAEAASYPERSFWFPARDGGHVTRQEVSRRIRQGLAAAGVNASAHQLRHTFGTSLLDAGVDVRVVQELMRHSSLQTTQIYTRVSAEQRTTAIERLALPAGPEKAAS